MRRARGFTLLELVVTVIIAAILAAYAIPRLAQPELDAAWFHEQVKSAVRYAQRQAVAQRRAVYVVVQANQVELCYAADCSVRLVQVTTGAGYVVSAPSGVSLAPATTFSFNGLGQPSAGIALTVGGKPLQVAAETGYVR